MWGDPFPTNLSYLWSAKIAQIISKHHKNMFSNHFGHFWKFSKKSKKYEFLPSQAGGGRPPPALGGSPEEHSVL
jgi:hypothetical protein